VVAVDCVSSVTSYFKPYGNIAASGLKLIVNVALPPVLR
jgi:hypothetical protein